MDEEKMRQIGQGILALPERFNMNRWFEKVRDESAAKEVGRDPECLPPCGTTCCFAGEWAVRFQQVDLAGDLSHTFPDDDCVAALGLPNYRLFYTSDWPERFRNAERLPNLPALPGTPEYARFFVDTVLEDYIATNGWADNAPL
jgi:hypothetical protein